MSTKTQRQAEHISEYRFEPRAERLVASNGEIQANDKKDLLQQQQRLMAAAAARLVQGDSEVKAARDRKALLAAMKFDSEVHKVVGERMTNELYVTSNRKGYMRRFLARHDVEQGNIVRIPVRQKNVQAFILTGPSRLETQLVRDNYLMPDEVQVATRPFIPMNALNQDSSDILNEKYVEALEGIMVQEDRMWYNMAKQAIGLANNMSVIAGELTPKTLMNVSMNVQRWGLTAAHLLMAADIIVDIIGNAEFVNAIEPVARHELVMTGQIATLYGMSIISEQYRHPQHKVVSQGEFVIVSDPLMHGAYTDRGGIDSEPTNVSTENVIGRGWVIQESISMVVANERSVAFGRRV